MALAVVAVILWDELSDDDLAGLLGPWATFVERALAGRREAFAHRMVAALGETKGRHARYAVGAAELPLEDRRELAWACDLHEIGMMVSHHDHHRHSAYLLAHVDARLARKVAEGLGLGAPERKRLRALYLAA